MNSPINADGAEIEDAGSTHHHIQSDKDVTVDLAEAPLSHHLRQKNTNPKHIKWQLIATLNTELAVLHPDKPALFRYFLVHCRGPLPVVGQCDGRQLQEFRLMLLQRAAVFMDLIHPPIKN